MTDKKPAPSQRRDVRICVLVIQVMFALAATGLLILDPEGILDEPRDQILAALVIVAPIVMAVVLAVRFGKRHRAEEHERDRPVRMHAVINTSHECVWAIDDEWLFTLSGPTSKSLLVKCSPIVGLAK